MKKIIKNMAKNLIVAYDNLDGDSDVLFILETSKDLKDIEYFMLTITFDKKDIKKSIKKTIKLIKDLSSKKDEFCLTMLPLNEETKKLYMKLINASSEEQLDKALDKLLKSNYRDFIFDGIFDIENNFAEFDSFCDVFSENLSTVLLNDN